MEFTTMARAEIAGKRPTQTADKAKRLPGPPIADATAIEPTAKSEPDSHRKGEATPVRGQQVPPAWYSVREFCLAHRLSISMYFKLKAQERGPREIAVGARRYITFEDAAEWRAAQQETALRGPVLARPPQ
jgi:hypothetical protein